MPNNRKDLGLRVAGTIFGLVALAHLVRLFLGSVIVIGPLNVPRWACEITFQGKRRHLPVVTLKRAA